VNQEKEKFMNKLTSLIRRAPKRFSAIVAIAAAAVIIPASLNAWGPNRTLFTTEKPAPYVTLNSITDNPSHGYEPNFMQVREASASNTTYVDEISLEAGKEYVMYMYYHNNAAANLNLVANDSYAKAELPAVVPKGSAGTVANGYVGASNANPTQVFDDVKFKNSTAGDIALRYVPGSTTIHSKGAVDGKTMSDSIVTTGAPIGYYALDGKVPGCDEFAGYVTFRFVADQPNFELSKQVRLAGSTTWNETVAAKDGDTVEYQVQYKNTGSTKQNDVVLKDALPKGLTYNSKSGLIKNASNPTPKELSDNIVTSTGVNIGNYTAGSNAFVMYSAKVNAKDLVCGANTLKNVASIHTNNGSKSDDAKVTITKECEPAKIKVCELATKKIITIDEKNFDKTKHSKNLNDCKETPPSKVKVCEIATKTIVTINESDFDATKHSKDLNVCVETPVTPETPTELPQTGLSDDIVALTGLGALIASAAYYIASRRALNQ